jgi:hypothetical protein
MTNRKKVPDHIQAELLTLSARRCALCFGVNHDYIEKSGQIAHLDDDPSNNNIDNLCWLCLEHHDKYDSTTSQSKNYTQKEVTGYRDSLYKKVESLREAAYQASLDKITKQVPESIETTLKDDLRNLLNRVNPLIIQNIDNGQNAIPIMISPGKLSALQQLITHEDFSNYLTMQSNGNVSIGYGNRIGNSINDVLDGMLTGYVLYPTQKLRK